MFRPASFDVPLLVNFCMKLTGGLNLWCWGLSVIVSCRYWVGQVPDFLLFFKATVFPVHRVGELNLLDTGPKADLKIPEFSAGLQPIGAGYKAPTSKVGKILFDSLEEVKIQWGFRNCSVKFWDFFCRCHRHTGKQSCPYWPAKPQSWYRKSCVYAVLIFPSLMDPSGAALYKCLLPNYFKHFPAARKHG